MFVEPLGEHHWVDGFSCGVETLDRWLQRYALENQRRDLARTFVLAADDGAILGYYALTMASVTRRVLPSRLGRGLPDVSIGMVLIGRLAVTSAAQGQGLGRDLMVDAMLHASLAGQHAAARFVGVDPIDEGARSFYARFGFVEIAGDPGRRLVLRLEDAVRALRGG